MIRSAAIDLSRLDYLENELEQDVSVSLLAELERELLRLRTESTQEVWHEFCRGISRRSIGRILQQGRVSREPGSDETLERLTRESLPARTLPATSLIAAWEHSLPISRSLRSRRAYFAREIDDILQSAVRPRILALGAGRMREADTVLSAARLTNATFLAVDPNWEALAFLKTQYFNGNAELIRADWKQFCKLSSSLGSFDLIYSPHWLDSTSDPEAGEWLGAAVELLNPQGRLVAACFAPSSRDAGWAEALFGIQSHYRSEGDCAELAMRLKSPAIRGHAVSQDESGASNYLEVHSL